MAGALPQVVRSTSSPPIARSRNRPNEHARIRMDGTVTCPADGDAEDAQASLF